MMWVFIGGAWAIGVAFAIALARIADKPSPTPNPSPVQRGTVREDTAAEGECHPGVGDVHLRLIENPRRIP